MCILPCRGQPVLHAAGGWLQVAQKAMPVSSLIVGIDLASIKAIRGVRTLVGDITTQKARQVCALLAIRLHAAASPGAG